MRLALGMGAVLDDMVIPLLSGIYATDGLGHAGGEVGHVIVGQREHALGLEHFFLDEHVLGEMSAEGVADAALVHAPAIVIVALTVADGADGGGGLNGKTLAGLILTLEIGADFGNSYGPLIAESNRVLLQVPAVDVEVLVRLTDDLEDAGAHAGSVNPGQELIGPHLRDGNLSNSQIFKTGPSGNHGLHRLGQGELGLIAILIEFSHIRTLHAKRITSLRIIAAKVISLNHQCMILFDDSKVMVRMAETVFDKLRGKIMAEHVFTGFGFGPIQSGLFLVEASASGNFGRLVVAEIDGQLVKAVRDNGGGYWVNVAHADRVETVQIDGVEMFDPTVGCDRKALLEALAESTEIATCLPAVGIYQAGGDGSVAALLAQTLQDRSAEATIIYAAENNNHAAEILAEAVADKMCAPPTGVQYLNTVIGKMSQVVTDPRRIERLKLKPIAPGIERAFLVEAFNHILATRCDLPGFRPGIEVFLEKDDLLPFEEAKLYGHNAIHALLAYLGSVKGYEKMTQLQDDAALMSIARDAFISESGVALIGKHGGLGDDLFTEDGFREYADDLLDRMTNPYLEDTIARAGRDPLRKLGYSDRVFGTMALAFEQGVEPVNVALGGMAGVVSVLGGADEYGLPGELRCDGPDGWRQLRAEQIAAILEWLWGDDKAGEYAERMVKLTQQAHGRLRELVGS